MIRNAATAIGVVTGGGTIVGWIVSTASPAVVVGTAVGYAGMAYCVGFALLGFAAAVLPSGALRRLEAEGLAKPGLTARALYFAFGCLFAALFAWVGTDPLNAVWIGVGAAMLALVASWALSVHRDRAATAKAELRECPDCAETIKKRARVCRYCGYRFAPPPILHAFTQEPPPRTGTQSSAAGEDETATDLASDARAAR